MRRIALAAIFLITAAAWGQDAAPLSLREFRHILRQARSSLQQSQDTKNPISTAALPDEWNVREGSRQFRVSTEWLRDGLQRIEKDPSKATTIRASLLAKIDALDAAAEDASAAGDVPAERARLAGILARREFGAVRGPSVWDRFRQWVNDLLVRILTRIFGSEAAPEIGTILIWLVIVGALGVLGWWALRLFRRGPEVMTIGAAPQAVPQKDWRTWLREARAAAAAGQWRDAVHHAYWAGVFALEGRGVWRSDRARTPREYLRAVEIESPYRLPLQSLTSEFEQAWYAGVPADASSYERASQSLEKLECQ